jgi:hypothetical protein
VVLGDFDVAEEVLDHLADFVQVAGHQADG